MNAEFDLTGIVIKTERLVIREWQLSDLDAFYKYASVPGVGECAGWKHHENKEESLERLNKFIKEKHVFAIAEKETNTVIGSLGVEFYGQEDKLTEFDGYKGREIGFVLNKDYWGRGIMTEAVKALIDYLFNVLDFDFLLCGHYDFNDRSKRVQEKCGFKPYRKLVFTTSMGIQEPGVLSLLINPNKNIKYQGQ